MSLFANDMSTRKTLDKTTLKKNKGNYSVYPFRDSFIAVVITAERYWWRDDACITGTEQETQKYSQLLFD